MPTTPKGIYYPGPTFPPQIVEDEALLWSNSNEKMENLAAKSQVGPDSLVAPFVYTSAPNGGDLVNLTNGLGSDFLLWVQYWGQVKKSASANLSVGIFINGNQLKLPVNNAIPAVQEINDSSPTGNFYGLIYTDRSGIAGNAGGGADTVFNATTGFTSANAAPVYIWGLSGTSFTIEIKYKVASGNLTLGQRYILGGVMKGI